MVAGFPLLDGQLSAPDRGTSCAAGLPCRMAIASGVEQWLGCSSELQVALLRH